MDPQVLQGAAVGCRHKDCLEGAMEALAADGVVQLALCLAVEDIVHIDSFCTTNVNRK